MNLQSFNIKGERCSGTNYLKSLIIKNLGKEYTPNAGWKHGFYTTALRHKVPLTNTLCIIIFRNPFDWIRSLYLNPHLIKDTTKGIWKRSLQPTFSQFIRTEAIHTDEANKEVFWDYHPSTFERAENLLQLRNWKNANFLNLKKVIPNCFYVRYEDLEADPSKIITEINDTFFKVKFEFKNCTNYKGDENWEYVKQEYFDISEEDYNFIVDNLDWELETKIGYTKNFTNPLK